MLFIWFLNSFWNNLLPQSFYYNFLFIYLIIIILNKTLYYSNKYLSKFNIKYTYNIFILNIENFFLSYSIIFTTILLKNNVFCKEGFYIDLLQKLSLDVWIKNFIYISTQLFNLNYLNNFIIKFIIYFIIYLFNNLLTNEDNLNLTQILSNILITFLFIWHLVFLIYLNIYILYFL